MSLEAAQFKVGDIVRVLRKAKTNEDGWENSWEPEMDSSVGNTATVVKPHSELKYNVRLVGEHVPDYGYPSFVLELVKNSDRSKVFDIAKKIAVDLAKSKPLKIVNADLVQAELLKQGYTSSDLGNAAGALFRGKNWIRYFRTKSNRKGNHKREITNWQYIGQ